MSDKRLADAAIKALQRKHVGPFFISCGLFHPHYPWYVPQKYLEMYPLYEITLPSLKADDLDDVPDHGQRLVNIGWDEKVKDEGLIKEAIRGYQPNALSSWPTTFLIFSPSLASLTGFRAAVLRPVFDRRWFTCER